MNSIELEFCTNYTQKLLEHPLASAFVKPVDPELDNAPGYFDVIEHPMDLETIQNKIGSGEYPSAKEWMDDIALVWSNCMKYNHQSTFIYRIAEFLAEKTKRRFQRLPSTEKDLDKEQIRKINKKIAQLLQRPPNSSSLIPPKLDLQSA